MTINAPNSLCRSQHALMSYDDETTAEESHSRPRSLKRKALEFLYKSDPEGRDAARGKQVLMFRALSLTGSLVRAAISSATCGARLRNSWQRGGCVNL